MKIKLKLVAAAVAMVVTGQASAAYAPGELMLTVWDKVGQKSYTRDLGINLDSVLANPSAFSLNVDLSADANYAGFLGLPSGNASAATWGITAAKVAAAPTMAQAGMLVTAPTPVPAAAADAFQGMTYEGIMNGQASWFSAVSETRTVGQTGYAGDASWGDSMAGNLNVMGALGTLDLTLVDYSTWTGGATGTISNLSPVTLTSAGMLTTAAAAPVPVPAAAWLLGSALIGMAGMARRRDDEAQAA